MCGCVGVCVCVCVFLCFALGIYPLLLRTPAQAIQNGSTCFQNLGAMFRCCAGSRSAARRGARRGGKERREREREGSPPPVHSPAERKKERERERERERKKQSRESCLRAQAQVEICAEALGAAPPLPTEALGQQQVHRSCLYGKTRRGVGREGGRCRYTSVFSRLLPSLLSNVWYLHKLCIWHPY